MRCCTYWNIILNYPLEIQIEIMKAFIIVALPKCYPNAVFYLHALHGLYSALKYDEFTDAVRRAWLSRKWFRGGWSP